MPATDLNVPHLYNGVQRMKFAVRLLEGFGYTLYTLSNLTTKYGTIPAEYASIADYPFVVFDEKGTFIAAATALYGQNQSGSSAIAKAIYTVLGDNAYTNGKWKYENKKAMKAARAD